MGANTSTPSTEKFSEVGENDRVKFGLSTMQGWRPKMEDAHAAVPNLDEHTSFFGVYDGHGGDVVALFCAKYLHTQVLKSEGSTADLPAAVQNAFLRMDDMMQGQRGWRELAALRDKGSRLSRMFECWIRFPKTNVPSNLVDDWPFEEGPHSDFIGPTEEGSTACVAVIRNNQIIVGNAGDSRCVLSKGGQAHELSKDHKPHLDLERERITKAGGFVYRRRVKGILGLSRAIGDMQYKQNKSLPPQEQMVTCNPDINIVEISDDTEFLVLASDGIWDCMRSQAIVDFVRDYLIRETDLAVICERVLDRCLAPSSIRGYDNMTIILVQLKNPACQLPPPPDN